MTHSFRILSIAALASTAALSLTAQTVRPAARRATPARPTSAAAAGCVTVPAFSPKIPALQAGAPCAKALYTVTRKPEVTIEYMSPLLSPAVREALDTHTHTYSLLYTDSVLGTGEPALPGKFLSVKYTGYLVDGSKFDSSNDHPGAEPITFPYGQHRVIPGWDTGFEGMKTGGKRRLYIPYELAYGDQGRPPVIPAKSMLIFDMELVAVNDKEPAPKPAPTPTPAPALKPADAPKPATDPAKPAAEAAQPKK